MAITIALTELLRISHPVLLAPMDLVSDYAQARSAGDFEIAAVIAGEASGLIHGIPSARDVIDRILRDASTLLSRRTRQVEPDASSG